MASRASFGLSTYQRLEEGRMSNPGLAYLVNAAIALGEPLEEVIELEWLSWFDFWNGEREKAPMARLCGHRR